MRRVLISILVIIMLITSCGLNTTDDFNIKKKGGYNYVKDNTYYYVSNDGTRYVFGKDSVENSNAYSKRKSRKELEELDSLNLGFLFSDFNLGLGFVETKTIDEKFKTKNFYPKNYINLNNDLTLLEHNYDYGTDTVNINISTESIIKKDPVKRLINNEEDLINNDENNEIEIDDEIDEKIDSIILDGDEFSPFNYDNYISTSSELFENNDISTLSEIDEVNESPTEYNNKLDSIGFIDRDNYLFDESKNDIYYVNSNKEFYKYNVFKYNNDLIDDNIEKIKIYDKDNIIYYKKVYNVNDDNKKFIVFYSINKGIIKEIEINNIDDVIFDNYNKDIVYYLTDEDNKSLYYCNIKGEKILIDNNIRDVYGKTKKYLYYSKDDEINIPYNYFLIDNVSSGEWLGEEPKLSNYKLNNDPFSFDFDIDGYTQARLSYKYKEKFLNDRKKYVERNIENIKNNNYIINANKLYSFDGKNTNIVNDNYIRNVYIVDSDKDILYFETDANIYYTPIEKKTLGEFVTANILIDQYINDMIEKTRKEYLFYVSSNNNVSLIHDIDFYRGYIDKTSQLYYDLRYRKDMIENEKRNIIIYNNNIYLVGVSYKTDKKAAYKIELGNNKEIFADNINMEGFSDIKFIDYVKDPIYVLYDNNDSVLKYGIKDIAKNVVVDSVAVDKLINKIAYVEKNDNNLNGILHMMDLNNFSNDKIISNNAFYYNIFFDNLTNDLCFLINFNETEEYGTFLTYDTNNNLNFIDDEVMYIIKN